MNKHNYEREKENTAEVIKLINEMHDCSDVTVLTFTENQKIILAHHCHAILQLIGKEEHHHEFTDFQKEAEKDRLAFNVAVTHYG